MDYAIFLSVLLLQTSMILFPEWLNAVLFYRIPREKRMDPAWHVPIAAIALLLFTVLFFDAIYKDHPLLFPAPDDTTTIPVRYIAGAAFAALGLFFCIRPARTLKWIPQMRNLSVASLEENATLIRFAQTAGIVQVVGGSYWLFRILEDIGPRG
jgi:hypothetical protein